MYKQGLALNNLQGLIYYKTQLTNHFIYKFIQLQQMSRMQHKVNF